MDEMNIGMVRCNLRSARRIFGDFPLLRFLFVLTVINSSSGCQTTAPVIQKVSLPLSMAGIFDACHYGDGAITIDVKRDGAVIFENVNVDWMARGTSGWVMEVFNPLGQTSLSLKYDARKLKFEKSGILADRIPEIIINKRGFMEIGGEYVPIRPEEMVCFLKNKLPQKWTNNIVNADLADNRATFYVSQSGRQMIIEIQNSKRLDNEKVCVRFVWKKYLGLVRNSMELCEKMGRPKEVYLKSPEGFDIKWTNLED